MGNNDWQWCVIVFCDQWGNTLRAALTLLSAWAFMTQSTTLKQTHCSLRHSIKHYKHKDSSERGTEQPSRDHEQTKGMLSQCGYFVHAPLEHTTVYLWVVPQMPPVYNSLPIAILASIPFVFHPPKLVFVKKGIRSISANFYGCLTLNFALQRRLNRTLATATKMT